MEELAGPSWTACFLEHRQLFYGYITQELVAFISDEVDVGELPETDILTSIYTYQAVFF